MNKFFERIAKFLIIYSLNFNNIQALKYEITHKNLSYIIDDKSQTAVLNKVSKDSNGNAPLDIPAFVEFCENFFRVVGLEKGCIDPFVFFKINKVNIPYTISKNDNNKSIFYSLLSSPNIKPIDKFIIKDYFDSHFDKNLSQRQKNSPIQRAELRYSFLNGFFNH